MSWQLHAKLVGRPVGERSHTIDDHSNRKEDAVWRTYLKPVPTVLHCGRGEEDTGLQAARLLRRAASTMSVGHCEVHQSLSHTAGLNEANSVSSSTIRRAAHCVPAQQSTPDRPRELAPLNDSFHR